MAAFPRSHHDPPNIMVAPSPLPGIREHEAAPSLFPPRGSNNLVHASKVFPKRVPLYLLKKITNGFSLDRELGTGAYGKVYKGVLKNGETIAVKLLHSMPGLDDERFEKEFHNLARLQHKNIVRLVGFCHEIQREFVLHDGGMIFADRKHMALCFEYMHNGSLDKYIFDEYSGHDWPTRYAIIKGICEGLKYLHEELNPPIYHLDLKPANILLDDNMMPKLADFGLSKIFEQERTQITKSCIGTRGYLPPEYIDENLISNKLDIFSLGVIIIKIITGPTGYTQCDEMPSKQFVELVHQRWKNRLQATPVDEYALETYSEQVMRCIEMALTCVEKNRHKRPSIGAIIEKLNKMDTTTDQFNELQECYLQRRRTGAQARRQEERDIIAMNREGYHAGLQDFQSVLTTFTRYSRLRVIAELRHGDLLHSANIVSSIEFDRDDELFATAELSKRRIKVFEFSTVVNEPSDVHCPVVEMATRSKLSCLSWNKYSKNVIASSDYEGIVTVWDVQTRQSVMEYEEHEKRAWSVDFSRTDPSMLVSGSDDCKVKVWCTKQEASVINIDMKANICSVKYNPGSNFYVAVGSVDHHIHYFDLRNPSAPVHIFGGHKKAVSYVKFLSNNELASASTDSTLRLWDVKDNCPVRTFRGHKNEKNFVGLSANNEYIACGSETNEVFVYHKAISKPAASHRFVSSDLDDADDDPGSYFISAVCWKSDSPTMLAANSQGTIKVLVLAP